MNNSRPDAGFALFLHYLSICDVIKVGEYTPEARVMMRLQMTFDPYPQYVTHIGDPVPLNYWLGQYKQILAGETGPDMHDASLVFPSWRDDPYRAPVCIWA